MTDYVLLETIGSHVSFSPPTNLTPWELDLFEDKRGNLWNRIYHLADIFWDELQNANYYTCGYSFEETDLPESLVKTLSSCDNVFLTSGKVEILYEVESKNILTNSNSQSFGLFVYQYERNYLLMLSDFSKGKIVFK